MLAEALSWLLLLGGSAFLLIGGIGVLRMPDFYTRLHAAGLTDTLAAGLILAGLAVQGGASLVSVKLVLIFALLLFTSPTATHALAQAAMDDGVRPVLAEETPPSRS